MKKPRAVDIYQTRPLHRHRKWRSISNFRAGALGKEGGGGLKPLIAPEGSNSHKGSQSHPKGIGARVVGQTHFSVSGTVRDGRRGPS